ncbi:MAG: class I SAM-dependent methyltransferase, partial [Chloroflexi bacterium]|nr:class I SAM-dependent methyltransferase [Chloroflexota bacterium]
RAQALSFGQYYGWRCFAARRLRLPTKARVLDVCTGTAGVAIEIAHVQPEARIAGIDLSREMLLSGRERLKGDGLDERVALLEGRAERLPFTDGTFDAVVFTFLLRYVAEPSAVLRELARVVKPDGQMVSLEFTVPPLLGLRESWMVYTGIGLPVMTLPLGSGWRRVGRFLGRSIWQFDRAYPVNRQKEMWREVGFTNVQSHRLSLGGAVVIEGTKGG